MGRFRLTIVSSILALVLTACGQTRDRLDMSRPEIGLHELTCKQDEKIRKEHPRTGVYCSRVFNWGFYVS